MRFADPTLAGGAHALAMPKKQSGSRDEEGAIMIIGLFFALFLVGTLYYLIGIGEAIIYRERMQDAADTAAFAGAVLKARGMNLIALINIIMAGLLAILILVYTLYLMAAALGRVILPAACAAGFFCPPCAAIACPLIAPANAAANGLLSLYNSIREPIRTLLRLGSTAAEAVSIATPAVSIGASLLRVQSAYQPPALAGISLGNPPVARLPTRKAPFDELCKKATKFTKDLITWVPRQILPLLGTVIGWISGPFVDIAARVVCEGGSPPDLNAFRRPADDNARTLPGTPDQDRCLNTGDAPSCQRFQDYMQRARWDQTTGLCRDTTTIPVVPANLPAGADADTCDMQVNGASRICLQAGAQRRFAYTYRLVTQTEKYRGNAMTGVARDFPDQISDFAIQGPQDTPLCGDRGTWTTSQDASLQECYNRNSIRIDPAPPFPMNASPNTLDEARVNARAIIMQNMGPELLVRVTYRRVQKILICKEELGPRPAEAVEAVGGGCNMSPQWLVPRSLENGDEPFQVWGLVVGRDGNFDHRIRGVSAGNRFADGGTDVGPIRTAATTLGRFSFAQAEFYYGGGEGKEEWLWNMSWTARMRRVRMPSSIAGGGGISDAAAAGGGGGGAFGGFNLGSISDRVIIH